MYGGLIMLTWPLPSSLFDFDEEQTDIVISVRRTDIRGISRPMRILKTSYVTLLYSMDSYRRRTRSKGGVQGN